MGGGSRCSALAPLLRAPSLKPSCSKASNARSWSPSAPCVIYIHLTGASSTATWVRVALQTLSETASLPLLPAMVLGFMVLLLVGTVGTGKSGVAEVAAVWGGALRGGRQDWAVQGGC